MNFLIKLKSSLEQNPYLKHLLAVFLIISCLLWAYGNTFQNKFMMDDYVFIVGKDTLADRTLTEIWTKDFNRFYRPFGFTVLRFVNILSGNNYAGYQVATFGMFAAVCVLFYAVLLKLFKDRKLAILATLLYAVHPINNVFINYKTELINLTYIICMQAGTLFFLDFLEEKRWRLYGLSLLCYLLALLSHEISFMLPAFLFLIGYFFKRRPFEKTVYLCIGYGLVFAVFFLLRTNIAHALKVPGIFELGITLGQYVDLLRRSLIWYFKQLVWPNQILLVWDEEILDKFNFVLNLLVVLFFAVTGRWSFLKGKGSRIGLSWLIFLTGFLPVLLISFVHTSYLRTAIMEPHWFGFSSIGFFILLAMGIIYLQKWLGQKIWIVGVAGLISMVCMVTRESNAYWKDEVTYAKYWAHENKMSAEPLYRLIQISTSDKGLNINHYKSCEEISWQGMIYQLLNRGDLSVLYNNLALNKDKNCACAQFFFGFYFYEKKDYGHASLAVNKAHNLKPEIYPSYEAVESLFEDAIVKVKASARVRLIKMYMGLSD